MAASSRTPSKSWPEGLPVRRFPAGPANAMLAHPPIAVHFVDAVNWPAVQQQGLSPAASLMQREGLGEDSHSRFRPTGKTLRSGAYLRDQRPMPPSALQRCLDPDLAPEDWYALVNEGVYFWLDPMRADRHQRALRGRRQVRLELSVDRIIDFYGPFAFVTPFNIGSAQRRPARRGLRSLVPFDRWRSMGWQDEAPSPDRIRPVSHKPVELVVRHDMPDAMRFVVGTHFISAEGPPE